MKSKVSTLHPTMSSRPMVSSCMTSASRGLLAQHNMPNAPVFSAPIQRERIFTASRDAAICNSSVHVENGVFVEQADLDVPAKGFDTIKDALDALARGEHIVVLDDEDRENEGDLIIPADKVTTESMAFLINQTSGLVCVGMRGADLDRLKVPLMVTSTENEESMYTAFTVSVDLRENTSTGISASDRAQTLRALADPNSKPADFRRPGHIFPLRARELGVLVRPGHTEAAVDLSRLAGCAPAGVLCELVNHADGSMQRTPQLKEFAQQHKLRIITIADLIRYRLKHEHLLQHEGSRDLETRSGHFTAHSFRSLLDGSQHVAVVLGDVKGKQDVLTIVHEEDLLADVFANTERMAGALDEIAQRGAGIVVYLRRGKGEDLLRSTGEASTSSANSGIDHESQAPYHAPYVAAAKILQHLGVGSIALQTGNATKFRAVSGYGIGVKHMKGSGAPVTEQLHINSNGGAAKHLAKH